MFQRSGFNGIKVVLPVIQFFYPEMKSSVLFIAAVLLHSFTLFPFSASNANVVKDVLKQTNEFRRSKGLNQLVMLDQLNAIAREHSEDMAHGRVAFGHGGFSQREALEKKKIKGVSVFGENVAYGPTSGKQVVVMWENSAGHRRNLLGPFKYIGIGIAKDKQGRIYYTQVFAG
jgi:uncharacterized protein YkwD